MCQHDDGPSEAYKDYRNPNSTDTCPSVAIQCEGVSALTVSMTTSLKMAQGRLDS
jgi:hypothetical protein